MFNKIKSFVSTPTGSPAGTPIGTPVEKIPATGPTLPEEKWVNELKAQVPVFLPDECVGCDTGFGEGVDGQAVRVGGHEEEEDSNGYPKAFDVDYDSEMLGTSKPMHRLALISSSKTDWPRDISSDQDSLAFFLESVTRTKAPPASSPSPAVTEIPGVYQTSESEKLTILASSVEPSDDPSEDHHDTSKTSVLVFPDFKVVSRVNVDKSGAQRLYDRVLSPTVGLAGASLGENVAKDGMESWVLPYRAVVLLCSHKTRDKKCHIASGLLEQVICSTLSVNGYTADTTGEALHDLPASEQLESIEGGDQAVKSLLRKVAGVKSEADLDTEGSKEIGVFKISHLGGHRYAGVMIICFPSGSILYYGRVTPKTCVDVVEKTILKGQVLPEHLRGGGNLRREPGKTLLDW